MPLLFGLTIPLFAQTYNGAIRDAITDPSGAAISGASITLTDDATHQARSTKSDNARAYVFNALTPSTYTLHAVAPSFSTAERTHIALATQDLLTLDIQLAVGSATDVVQVSADAPWWTHPPHRSALTSISDVWKTFQFLADKPIVIPAEMAGFSNQSHFAKEFRTITGTTPRTCSTMSRNAVTAEQISIFRTAIAFLEYFFRSRFALMLPAGNLFRDGDQSCSYTAIRHPPISGAISSPTWNRWDAALPGSHGYGDSEKLPNSGAGSYRFVEQRRYLDALLEALDVRERVTLVVHDWGSGLGFDWADRHREAVKGIAYMEAILGPQGWDHWDIMKMRPFLEALRSDAGEARQAQSHNRQFALV